MSRKKISKLIFIFLIGIVPVMLWLSAEGRQAVLSDFHSAIATVAKAAGLMGLGFFSGNLILSGRYRLLDKLFGGLDQLYLFHRKTGITAFCLLLTHATLISLIPLEFGIAAVWQFMFDFSNSTLNYGRISLAGLVIIVSLTLLLSGKFRYEILKKMHQFLGVFFFFGGLHAFFIPSDIASNLYLRYYMLTLMALALASYLWRTVLKKWLLPLTPCEVVAVNDLGGNVTEVVMRPKHKKIHFHPGQFIFIKFRQPGFPREDHPFSLTASNADAVIKISAKQIGDFTKTLPQLKPGAIALVQGPFGGFSFTFSRRKKQIWIAGGIGVTPFVSMARSLRDNPAEAKDYSIDLVYSVVKPEEYVYLKELQAISQAVPNLRLTPWLSSEKGYLNAAAIQKITSLKDTHIMICGPKPMMMALRDQFRAAGVAGPDIHFELFRLL